MNSFLAIAQERYTTKKYDPNKKISAEKIQALKEILRLSPSSVNSQPWKFVFVADQAIKSELSKHSLHNTSKVLDCSHLVVFCGIDAIDLLEHQLEEKVHKKALDAFQTLVKTGGDEKVNHWISSQIYFSAGYFLSACAVNGIDSSPIDGIIGEAYDKILDIPNYKSIMAVAIGYRRSDDRNQPSIRAKKRLTLDEVILDR